MTPTKEMIQAVLARTDVVGMHAIGRALVHLRNRQTDAERRMEQTTDLNGRGFTGADAEFGTRLANFYEKNNYLTPKQMAVWQKRNVKGTARIAKYWAQLLQEAQKKAAGQPVAV